MIESSEHSLLLSANQQEENKTIIENQQKNAIENDNHRDSEANDHHELNSNTIANEHAEQQSERNGMIVYDGGVLKVQFKLRKFSIRVTVITCQQQSGQKPENLHELFNSKPKDCQSQRFSIALIKTNIPATLRKYFKTLANLYNFIRDNLKDQSKIAINKNQIKFTLPSESEKPKQVKLSLKELYDARYNNNPINLENIEERLLQFSNEEMEFIDNAYLAQESQGHIRSTYDSDEELFLEIQTQQMQEDEDNTPDLTQLEAKQKQIEEFEKKFPIFKKPLPTYFSEHQHQLPLKASNNEENMAATSVSGKSSVFPPGYVPPHLAKQTAPDGLTSDQHLRFQANQSKKEKLKMAKQMLKMGYSTSEVIQKLEAQERASKTGGTYVDPAPVPSKNNKSLSAPSVQSKPQQPPPNNDRAVREMLISLIRAKTYKKLDDIQRHMANEGLQTTVPALKRIVDEIKAKNAQRKAQTSSE